MSTCGETDVTAVETKRNMVKILETLVVRLNKSEFKSLLQLVPDLFKELIKLTPMEASKFMHAVNMTWADRRRCSIMFQKLLQVIFCRVE